MRRFWISWEEPVDDSDDSRPLKWPLPSSIPAWWQSGSGDGYHTLCAVVDIKDEEAAREVIKDHWQPSGWRFCEEHPADWIPNAGRFPWPRKTEA
jgi:hypothetical protein